MMARTPSVGQVIASAERLGGGAVVARSGEDQLDIQLAEHHDGVGPNRASVRQPTW